VQAGTGSLDPELTESVLMKDAESTAATMQDLREKGVRVAFEDFGTGYSSLSYLKNFPIDALKIDQSFVRLIAPSGETQDELEFLQAHQCEEGKGYYFSRQVPPERFSKLLETGCQPFAFYAASVQ